MSAQLADRAGALLTRAQTAAAAGVPVTTIGGWEREGLIAASGRRAEAGETRPNLYTRVDVALARVLAAGRRAGLPRASLRLATETLRRLDLQDGDRGHLMLDDDGARFLYLGAALAPRLAAAAGVVVLLPVAVPSSQDAS